MIRGSYTACSSTACRRRSWSSGTTHAGSAGEIGATLILHTWGQTLSQHLHLHCLVAAGALRADGHWIGARRGFLFPVQALSKVFRGKFLAALPHADTGSDESVLALASLRSTPWVVYAKQPFGGPQQVLEYLGRYTHRTAIANERLLSCGENEVRFTYTDYAHGNRRKVLSLAPTEFIRRVLLHVLPRGFMRIRHYGLLANRAKHSEARCRAIGTAATLACVAVSCTRVGRGVLAARYRPRRSSVPQLWLRTDAAGHDPHTAGRARTACAEHRVSTGTPPTCCSTRRLLAVALLARVDPYMDRLS